MARTVKDQNLQSGEARRRLKVQGKPHYRSLEEGLHLGYRRLRSGAGKWVLRRYVGEQAYAVETIALADDLSDANGATVLSFDQAQARARELRDERDRAAAGKHGPVTVADALAGYLSFLDARRKGGRDARWKSDAFIIPTLGRVEVAKLTTERLEKWLDEVAKAPPRVRTAKGEPQRHRERGDGRARRCTANRVWVILRAALNRAFRAGKAPSDAAWRRVEAFKGTDVARARYLTVAECVRIVNASAPDFRRLVQAALATGARYSELAALRAADFDPDSGTVHVATSKSGKGRRIVLNAEGAALFKGLAAGKPGDAVLLTRTDGSPWRKSYQTLPMRDACRNGNIVPAVSFHATRHAYASLAVANGAPLAVVAENLGHRDTRMCERHYRHFEKNYVADTIRERAPTFGFEQGNVTALR
jgi:integrase